MACPLCGCAMHAADGQQAALTQALWLAINALNSGAILQHSLGRAALADAALRDAALLRDFVGANAPCD